MALKISKVVLETRLNWNIALTKITEFLTALKGIYEIKNSRYF